MDPENQESKIQQADKPALQTKTEKPLSYDGGKNKRKLVIGIIAAILLIGVGVIVYMLLFPAKKVVVGEQSYVYACSVLPRDDAVSSLKYEDDKTKEIMSETRAFVPDGSDEDVNALTLLGDGKDYVSSSCRLTAARKDKDGKLTSDLIGLTVKQFADEKKAKEEFDKNKPSKMTDDQFSLPSYKDNSLAVVDDEEKESLKATVAYKNLNIDVDFGFVKSDNAKQDFEKGLDSLYGSIIKKIDAGDGNKPINLTGYTTYEGHKFIDICSQTDPEEFVRPLGDIGLKPELSAMNTYGSDRKTLVKDKEKRKQATNGFGASCIFDFNYTEDTDARNEAKEKSKKDEKSDDSSLLGNDKFTLLSEYPNYVSTMVYTFKDEGEAKSSYDLIKKEISSDSEKNEEENSTPGAPSIKSEKKLTDFKSDADAGLRYTVKTSLPATEAREFKFLGSVQTIPGTPEKKRDLSLVYVLKGNQMISITLTQANNGTPYKSTVKEAKDDQLKQMLDYVVSKL